jgi:hypothetical protein
MKTYRKETENTTEFFNADLYYEIWKIRSKKDSKHYFDYKNWALLENHELKGKRLFDKSTNKEYTVMNVYQEFYYGYFIKLLIMDDNDSSAIRFWKNISCKNKNILDAIEESKNDITFL